jgi:hypothetical protein
LEKELEARTRELSEARAQEAATAEVLRIISSAPGSLQPVFETILANATRLCGAKLGTLNLYDGEYFVSLRFTTYRLRLPRCRMCHSVPIREAVRPRFSGPSGLFKSTTFGRPRRISKAIQGSSL